MNLGTTRRGASAQNLATDRVRVITATLTSPAHLSHVSAYLDGFGPNAGPALLRAVLYDGDGGLLARSEELVVAQGAAAGWRTFRFEDAGGLLLGVDDYRIGLHVGGVTNTARVLVATPGAPPAASATDSYADGTSATLPTTSPLASGLPVFAALFAPYKVPDVEDQALARLPWGLSQRVLGASGPVRTTRRAATCGWHGTSVDPERGAFCIVRSDGPLADLVGERVRVTLRQGTRERVVTLYCHDEQPFPLEAAQEDLSLTRRAFLALAPWSTDSLAVSVEVLS